MDQVPSALAGVRVLDLAGPMGVYCTKLLADLGADVVRIEPPGGDRVRDLGPFLGDVPDRELSLYWLHFNTSKRGVTLNLETADGRELLRRLAARADVLVETFAPGYLEGIGLGYEQLHELNPRLIVTSITAYGLAGPYRDYQATDLTGMAAGGLLYECGWPDRPPVNMGANQAYHQTGAQAAAATLLALHARLWSGQGQQIDVSMQECLPMCMLTRMPVFAQTGEYEGRGGDIHRGALQGVFPCKDGYADVRLRARQGVWQRALAWIQTAGMAQDLIDPAYENFDYRRRNAQHIDDVFRAFFLILTKEELMDQGQRNGLIVGAVYTAEDIAGDPQLAARQFFVDVPRNGQTLRLPGAPFRLGETPWAVRRPAPAIGEHNLEVYHGELGLSREELLALKQAGAI